MASPEASRHLRSAAAVAVAYHAPAGLEDRCIALALEARV